MKKNKSGRATESKIRELALLFHCRPSFAEKMAAVLILQEVIDAEGIIAR